MRPIKPLNALATLITLFTLNTAVFAFWRMPCNQYNGLYRMDPIISPGQLSDHAHAVHGSAGFSMNSTYDQLRSSCTSCAVVEDQSAYWVPHLMFQYPDGTVEAVPPVSFQSYYFLHGDNIQPFPPGFAMVSGNTHRRTFDLPVPDPPESEWGPDDITQEALEQKAIGFNCLNYKLPGEPTLMRHYLPSKNFITGQCLDGLRLELSLQGCWDGENLDSDDHKSHVAYRDFVIAGNCPKSHPVNIPTLFYERVYAVAQYANVEGSFIMSNGDTTGFGYHGDFMSGWEPDFLKRAIDQCNSLSGLITDCPVFTINYQKTPQSTCNFTAPAIAADENCNSRRHGLCGNPGQRLAGPPDISAPAPSPAPVSPAPQVLAEPPPSHARLVDAVSIEMPQQLASMPPANGRIVWVTEWVDRTLTYTEFVKRAEPTHAVVEPIPMPPFGNGQ